MQIPRIIHQTWVDRQDVPGLEDIWYTKNPTFEYNFADDKQINNFIKTSFNSQIHDTYTRITCGAARADMYRYCVLYEMGGVYVDIDILPERALKNYVFTTDLTVVNDMYGLYNAFISCKKNHPLMLKCIETICDNINNNRHKGGGHQIFDLSGPRMFANVFKKFYNIPHNSNFPEQTTATYQILQHNPPESTITKQGEVLLLTQRQHDCQIEQQRTGKHYSNTDIMLYT